MELYSCPKWVPTSIQIIYLGNDDLIRQINTVIQRDDSVLRSLTTKLRDQSVAEMFDYGFS